MRACVCARVRAHVLSRSVCRSLFRARERARRRTRERALDDSFVRWNGIAAVGETVALTGLRPPGAARAHSVRAERSDAQLKRVGYGERVWFCACEL